MGSFSKFIWTSYLESYLKSYLESCLKVVEIMGLSHQKCIFDVDNLLFITNLYIR